MNRSITLGGCVCVLLTCAQVSAGPWDTVIFRDDFDSCPGPPNPNKWVVNNPGVSWRTLGRTNFPNPTPHPDSGWQGWVPTGEFPRVENGTLIIEHHLFNPYDSADPNIWFLGGEVHTVKQFDPDRAYRFEARVRWNEDPPYAPYPGGLVNSFFLYGFDGSKNDEIDIEFVSKLINNGYTVTTNTYNESCQKPYCPCLQCPCDCPWVDGCTCVELCSCVGDECVAPQGLVLSDWNTFRIYWYPSPRRIEWTWVLNPDTPEEIEIPLREPETDPFYIPDEPMTLYFNFWAPDALWGCAYNGNLQPVNDPNQNEISAYEIDYVEVRVPRSTPPVVEWARSGGGTSNDRGSAIAVDATGNTYVTGHFAGTATLGPFTLTSAGYFDIFVAKYDSNGNVLWAQSAGGISSDEGSGIAVDAAGNSYVTGVYRDTATFGSFTLTSRYHTDVFVAKYDDGGNVVWVRSGGGVWGDFGTSVAVDTVGNSYVTGSYGGTATFGSFTLISAGDFDIFVAKYNGSGNVIWAKSAGGKSIEEGSGIAVDAVGNSYVTGDFSGTASFGPFTVTSAGERDIFLAKYNTHGNALWAQSAGGTDSSDDPFGIAVDATGNSYVTGWYRGLATFGSFTLTSAGELDMFVAKYDTNGTVLWVQSAGGTSGDLGRGIAVDVAGGSYVTGFYGTTATFDSFTLTSRGSVDIFVVKYDADGNALWAQSAGGTAPDVGFGIAVDPAGNSYVTGAYTATATFAPMALTSVGGSDTFVAKYAAPCGSGSIDPGEECDDGGESVTCNADCTSAECGDGTVNATAGEECEPPGCGCCDPSCHFDPTAPEPNPMLFASAPQPASSSEICMTATTAVDTCSPLVRYRFDFVSGGPGGNGRPWESSTRYCDSCLAPGTAYTYRVKARDSATPPNETSYSSNATAWTYGNGDMERDGDGDLRDFALWQRCFQNTPIEPGCRQGDFDGDGAIDLSHD